MIASELILVGAAALGLHFVGKWKETTEPFLSWLWSKKSVSYWVTSVLLCAIALVIQPELADAEGMVLGMKPMTYAVVMCYGGGHAVSRLLGITEAAAEKKANRNA